MARSWKSPALAAVAVAVVGGALALGSAAYAAPPEYVALGDSYSAGTGTKAYDYDRDKDGCKRSTKSYPARVAPSIGTKLTFVACNGAETKHVLANQLKALKSTTKYVSISIGGNDSGFAAVVTQCAKPWPFTCGGDITKANTFIRNTLPGRLDNVYKEIRKRAPKAKVVVVGYPRLFNGKTCNVAARISADEQRKLNATADVLASTISARAKAHKFTFIDPRSNFAGHEVCTKSEWLNGLSKPTHDSFHPNQKGHEAYGWLVWNTWKKK